MTNFPNVPITTINGSVHSTWHQNALDENPQPLTKVLSVINFLSPPITSVERGLRNTLTSRVQNEIAKDQLDHVESHHSEKKHAQFHHGLPTL